MQNNSSTIEKLKQAINVLQSKHIQSVEIGYEYSDGDTRHYTAVTEKVNVARDGSNGAASLPCPRDGEI